MAEKPPPPGDENEFLAPDDGGWHFTIMRDWIAVCPDISPVSARLYWIIRSIMHEKGDKKRRLSIDQLCWLLPGVNGKPTSETRAKDALRDLEAIGLLSNPDGDVTRRWVTDSKTGKQRKENFRRWQVHDYPKAGYVTEYRSALAKLDAYPGREWRTNSENGFLDASAAAPAAGIEQEKSKKAKQTPATSAAGASKPLRTLYAIQDTVTSNVKIGISANTPARMSQLQGLNPEAELRLIWSARASYETEQAVHEALAEHRVEGEWFNFSELADPVLLIDQTATALGAAKGRKPNRRTTSNTETRNSVPQSHGSTEGRNSGSSRRNSVAAGRNSGESKPVRSSNPASKEVLQGSSLKKNHPYAGAHAGAREDHTDNSGDGWMDGDPSGEEPQTQDPPAPDTSTAPPTEDEPHEAQAEESQDDAPEPAVGTFVSWLPDQVVHGTAQRIQHRVPGWDIHRAALVNIALRLSRRDIAPADLARKVTEPVGANPASPQLVTARLKEQAAGIPANGAPQDPQRETQRPQPSSGAGGVPPSVAAFADQFASN